MPSSTPPPVPPPQGMNTSDLYNDLGGTPANTQIVVIDPRSGLTYCITDVIYVPNPSAEDETVFFRAGPLTRPTDTPNMKD